MKKIIFITILIIWICIIYKNVSAYDDQVTHRKITEKAIGFSNIENYIIRVLGLSRGLITTFPDTSDNSIKYWLMEGSKLEDQPLSRAANHFHNPLKPWNESYVTDSALVSVSAWLTGWTPLYSNVTWATGYLTPAPDGLKQIITRPPDRAPNNWDNARAYFMSALTATTSTERETNFAKTFQAVGQVMHLLQDMAVPAHVRNDFKAHLTFGYGSVWPYNPFEHYVKGHPDAVTSAPTVTPSFTNSRVTSFWDTNIYTGGAQIAITDLSTGLAEWTNSNFFSDDTIFLSQNFPYPSKTDTNARLVEVTAEDGQTDRCYYIYPNGQNYKLAAYSYFTSEQVPALEGWRYNLDDEVYKDNSILLLPRAVGYSADLLDYFFRGEINFVPGGTAMNQYEFTNGTTEDMTGTFSIYYDDMNYNRIPVIKWENVYVPAMGQSIPVIFTGPTDTMPMPREKDKYVLVFHGSMGNEANAVAGKVVKLVWREEWDNGFQGNHPWLTEGIDIYDYQALDRGVYAYMQNQVSNGKLIKGNTNTLFNFGLNQTWIGKSYEHYVGTTTGYYCMLQMNGTPVDRRYCVPYDFGSGFPIPLTPNTRVRVKVDEMSIDPMIPAQAADCYLGTGQYQGMHIFFDNGENLIFSVRGQEPQGAVPSGHVAFITGGVEYAVNIFDAYQKVGITFREPVNIEKIQIVQQLLPYCFPNPPVENYQKMVVDYIRLEEQ
jgi:hypothetical protein